MSWIISAVSRLVQIGYGFWHDLVMLANKVKLKKTYKLININKLYEVNKADTKNRSFFSIQNMYLPWRIPKDYIF
jgi:hypothetical protein